DRLLGADRERVVAVGFRGERLGNELVARDAPHRLEHTLVADPAPDEDLDHAIARASVRVALLRERPAPAAVFNRHRVSAGETTGRTPHPLAFISSRAR